MLFFKDMFIKKNLNVLIELCINPGLDSVLSVKPGISKFNHLFLCMCFLKINQDLFIISAQGRFGVVSKQKGI